MHFRCGQITGHQKQGPATADTNTIATNDTAYSLYANLATTSCTQQSDLNDTNMPMP